MSIYSITVNCTYYDLKHLSKEDIDKKEDYSYTLCWENAKFNKGTNANRFWKFYQLVFLLAYQANSITWQAFTQLVNTLTKATPTPDDKDLVKRLLLKLVESICYHYSPKKSVAVTAQIVREVIAETTGFAERSTSHTVFVSLKRRK